MKLGTGKFLDPLDLRYTDGNVWTVMGDFAYVSSMGLVVTVEAGFQTDLASIPRALWWWLPPSGEYDPAAVLHDWLYARGELSRAKCDELFLDAMLSTGVSRFRAYAMHEAVRLFGWFAWDRKRRL